MMNNLSSTPEFPKFPIEEFKEELEQGHAEFKSAIQKSTQKVSAQLKILYKLILQGMCKVFDALGT